MNHYEMAGMIKFIFMFVYLLTKRFDSIWLKAPLFYRLIYLKRVRRGGGSR